MILRDADGITETLEMVDLALAEEFDGVTYIGIIHKAEDVVVCCARFLLCCYCICTTFAFSRIQVMRIMW